LDINQEPWGLGGRVISLFSCFCEPKKGQFSIRRDFPRNHSTKKGKVPAQNECSTKKNTNQGIEKMSKARCTGRWFYNESEQSEKS